MTDRMQQRYAASLALARRNQQKEKLAMSKKIKWPDVSDRDKRIASIRSRMTELFDKAEAESKRRQRLEATPSDSAQRFPAVKRGAR